MLGIILGSVVGVVAVAIIGCFAILVLCFVVPCCPMRKLHSRRYARLYNENNPSGTFAETGFADVSSSPPLNTLNLTSATATGIIPTGYTLVNNPGTDVHAVDPSTATFVTTPSDTLATTPSATLATTPDEAVSMAPDDDTARRPPQFRDTVPSPDVPPPVGRNIIRSILPASLEADDTNVL